MKTLGRRPSTRLEVEDFPVIVVNDTKGNDLYQQGMQQYATLKIDIRPQTNAENRRGLKLKSQTIHQ